MLFHAVYDNNENKRHSLHVDMFNNWAYVNTVQWHSLHIRMLYISVYV